MIQKIVADGRTDWWMGKSKVLQEVLADLKRRKVPIANQSGCSLKTRKSWVVQVMNMLKHSLMSQNIADYIYFQKVENAYLCMADLSPLLN